MSLRFHQGESPVWDLYLEMCKWGGGHICSNQYSDMHGHESNCFWDTAMMGVQTWAPYVLRRSGPGIFTGKAQMVWLSNGFGYLALGICFLAF